MKIQLFSIILMILCNGIFPMDSDDPFEGKKRDTSPFREMLPIPTKEPLAIARRPILPIWLAMLEEKLIETREITAKTKKLNCSQ